MYVICVVIFLLSNYLGGGYYYKTTQYFRYQIREQYKKNESDQYTTKLISQYRDSL